MLEIIALIFLCRKIGRIAEQKGLSPGRWKLLTIAAWIGFESAGLIAGIMLFGFDKNNLLGLLAFALMCAFGGYLFIKAILDKKPEKIEDEINKIGTHDLKPRDKEENI